MTEEKTPKKTPKEKMTVLEFPKKAAPAFFALAGRAHDLSTENWEVFWDDIITAMENRLKVFEVETKSGEAITEISAC